MRPEAWLTAAALALLTATAPAVAGHQESSPPAADGDAGAVVRVPCWEEDPPCSGATAEEGASDEEEAEAEPIVILRASGRGRPDDAEMMAWHRDYARQVAPLKTALARLLAAQPVTRPAHLGPQCRQLAAAVAAVDRRALLPAPDLVVDLYFKQALDQLAGAARACDEASFALTDYHLLEAGRALVQLDLALRHYRLGW